MNPFEKFMQEKRAGFGDAVRQGVKNVPGAMGNALVQGATTAVAGAAVAGVGLAANKIYDAMTKRRDFNRLLETNPDIAQHHQENPKMVNMMFTSLRSMNPSFSSDPLVAGNYMRRMVDSPSSAGALAVEALGHRDATQSPMGDAFQRGAMEGVKGMKLPEAPHRLQPLREEVEEKELNERLTGAGRPRRP